MSRGFVKEYDDERLDEIPPTISALQRHLSAENGMRITLVETRPNPQTGKDIHTMSNGLQYTLDEDNRWCVIFA